MANGEKMGNGVKPWSYDIPSPWVEISHTLYSAGPPGSSITTVPLWHFSPSVVYASLFSRLSVLPSRPLSGSMRSSLSQLLSDLNRIVVRAPGAEQTDIPPFCSDRQREGEKEKNERKEGLCVSVIPFSSSWENGNSFTFSWDTNAVLVLMRELYWVQMGPGRNKTGENLRGVSLCSRILTPTDEFKPKWAFP